jgi:hypothetical protein
MVMYLASVISNGAKRAPQLTRIDFAVLPAACLSRLFNQAVIRQQNPNIEGKKYSVQ